MPNNENLNVNIVNYFTADQSIYEKRGRIMLLKFAQFTINVTLFSYYLGKY